MIIGRFTHDGDSDTYTGELYSSALPARVVIEPNDSRSARAPDYRVMADGHEIGAGWKRTSREKGRPFVSIHLDDPALPAPIEAMLSETGELIWNRPRAAAPRSPQPAPG